MFHIYLLYEVQVNFIIQTKNLNYQDDSKIILCLANQNRRIP